MSCQSSSHVRPSVFNAVYGEVLTFRTHVKLHSLVALLEEKLGLVIASERRDPSYQRARLSDGGIKPEGVLERVIKIDRSTLSDSATLGPSPSGEDPEEYIAFLERCARIEALANKQENRIVAMTQSPLADSFKLFAAKASFYPYNGEGVSDYGWGCCWRATQTALSAVAGEPGKLAQVPTFEVLFHLFGSNEVLEKIYVDFLIARKGMEAEAAVAKAHAVFTKSRFSPYQHPYGWSNPFVSQLMFHYYGLNSSMATVNGMPASLKERCLPDELLDAEIDFQTLVERLVGHFSADNPLPVVIDDGKFAMAIAGVKVAEGRTTIWFADPHIKGGANHPDTQLIYDENDAAASFTHVPDSMAGLYSLTFDPMGRQIDCSVKQHETMFSRNSYEGTQFHTKPWMFTFPSR